MSDTNQEPTMEEILASIRRIISEDDQPQAAGEPAAQAAPEPEPETEPDQSAEAHAADDEVLDLTDRVEASAQATPMETVGDLDVFPREEAPAPAPEPDYAPPPVMAEAPAPAPAAAPSWTAPSDDEGLVSRTSAESAAASFASLSQSLMMPQEGRSLEDIVREMMKPMLKDWLDQNLPAIVQHTVQEEVERIARARVR